MQRITTKTMIRTLTKIDSEKFLENNYIGNLSYIYNDSPFIVPITYHYDIDKNIIIGYSAKGHKVRAMRKKINVCFNVSEIDSVNSWISVLAHGKYNELSGSAAKAMLHQFSLVGSY